MPRYSVHACVRIAEESGTSADVGHGTGRSRATDESGRGLRRPSRGKTGRESRKPAPRVRGGCGWHRGKRGCGGAPPRPCCAEQGSSRRVRKVALLVTPGDSMPSASNRCGSAAGAVGGSQMRSVAMRIGAVVAVRLDGHQRFGRSAGAHARRRRRVEGSSTCCSRSMTTTTGIRPRGPRAGRPRVTLRAPTRARWKWRPLSRRLRSASRPWRSRRRSPPARGVCGHARPRPPQVGDG